MNWIKTNIKVLALLGGGAIVLAVLLAVILGSRQDRGFMLGKMDDATAAKYGSKAADCSKTPIHFALSAIPVAVAVDMIAGNALDSVIEASEKKWSDAVGHSLLRPPSRGGDFSRSRCDEKGTPVDPVIFITRTNGDGHEWTDEKGDGRGHAHPYWDASCNIRCAEIAFPGRAPVAAWQAIMDHEVGHALGLDHVDTEHFIMYPNIRFGGDRISDKELEALKGAY